MEKPSIVNIGGNDILLVDVNYLFSFTLCSAGYNCDEYVKRPEELDQRELDLIKGELIRQKQRENGK